jgi:hypothetical protein
VIGPQALRIAMPPTVGFLVQVIKGTALASVIGFIELTKAGTMITNATFKPFTVYACVALMYFALCWPIRPGADPGKEAATDPHRRRQITALRKRFGTNEVLKGIDLAVQAGEVIAIIGKSGSGKSTLLRCINGLEEFQDGALSVDGSRCTRQPQGHARAAPARGHDLPELQPVPAPDGGPQRDAGAVAGQETDAAAAAEARPARCSQRVGLAEKFDAWPDQLSGRPAAARGHRPRAGHGAQRDAVRRDHQRARPGAGGRSAARGGGRGRPLADEKA